LAGLHCAKHSVTTWPVLGACCLVTKGQGVLNELHLFSSKCSIYFILARTLRYVPIQEALKRKPLKVFTSTVVFIWENLKQEK